MDRNFLMRFLHFFVHLESEIFSVSAMRRKSRKTVKELLKDVVTYLGGFLGAVGIIFGPVIIFCIVIWVYSLFTNPNKPDEPTVTEYAKSSEQKKIWAGMYKCERCFTRGARCGI